LFRARLEVVEPRPELGEQAPVFHVIVAPIYVVGCYTIVLPGLRERLDMNMDDMVNELRQYSGRIARAIAALLGEEQLIRRGLGRPVGSKNVATTGEPKRRTMSASARARISAAQKARWAKQKGKSAPKKTTTAAKKSRRPMSPAARKKLSALMKARWAVRRKTA
jgi:hypothetical protein